MKRPAFQFYPADWLKDLALRTCSIAARGLWHEMLCVMHEATPYGHLSIAGASMNDEACSIATGVDLKLYRKLLAELESKAVFSRTDEGTIYSRRMVSDERIRNLRAASGSKGGNPHLVNQRVNQKRSTKDKQTPVDNSDLLNQTLKQKDNLVNQTVKQKPTPSSSSSSASKTLGCGGSTTVPSVGEPEHPDGNGQSNPLTPIFDTKQGEKQGKTFDLPPQMLKMPPGWRTDDRAADAAGRLLGLTPGSFESYTEYRRRISEKFEAYRLEFFGIRPAISDAENGVGKHAD